jgi:hypothetical protein
LVLIASQDHQFGVEPDVVRQVLTRGQYMR